MSTSNDARADAIRIIELLQKQYDPTRRKMTAEFQEEFLTMVAQKWDFTEGMVDELKKQMLIDTAGMFSAYETPQWFAIVSKFSKRIEASLFKKSRPAGMKKILFGTLNSGRINGMAIDIDNPEYHIILIEDGVFGFANLLAKGVAQTLPFSQSQDGQLHYSTDIDELKQNIEKNDNLQLRIIDLVLAYVFAGRPHAAQAYLPEKEYNSLISVWRSAIEYFVLSHEYGHAVCGHLDNKTANPVHDEFKKIPLTWQQEFQADYVGLITTLNILAEDRFAPSLTYAGVEAFFLGVELIERTLSLATGEKSYERGSASHPPASMRREAMRQWLGQQLDEEESKSAIMLASVVHQILEIVWPRLEYVARKIMADGSRPHGKWSNY